MEKLIENLEVRFYPSGRVAVINTTANLAEYDTNGINKAFRDITNYRNEARNQILKSASILTACGLTALTLAARTTREPNDFLLALGVGTIAVIIGSTNCFNLPEAIQEQKYHSKILKAFPAVVLSLEEMSSKRSSLRLPI